MLKVASETEVLAFLKETYGTRKRKYLGFYNSLFDKVIVDQQYMLMPVDDRTSTRGHGVFDVIYLKNFKLRNLDKHISRLHKSAQISHVKPPFSQEKTRDTVIKVVQSVVDYHLRNDPNGENKKMLSDNVGIRMTISSGFGDYSVASLGKEAILYVVLFEPYINEKEVSKGVKEYVTMTVDGTNEYVHAKTVNYLDNAVMANRSKEKGGYQGIKALKNNVLLEAASANIAFVFGKEFATPRFENVVKGTTIKKSLNFIEKLKEEGTIDKISFRDITIEEAQKADQMIVLGGDKIVPVLEFNDHKISDEKGPITARLQVWYDQTVIEDTPIKIAEQFL